MPRRWRSRIWGFLSWIASIIAGGTALVLADFGAPLWIFIALGVWLSTVGLPTTLGVVLVASAWGWIPGLGTPPLGVAAACAAIVSFVFQMAAAAVVARIARRIRRRSSCA